MNNPRFYMRPSNADEPPALMFDGERFDLSPGMCLVWLKHITDYFWSRNVVIMDKPCAPVDDE